jgi:ankyrin repeat protein
MVAYLVEKGANTEIMCDSASPLWIAASYGKLDVVMALVFHADKEARALDGATPLWVACENGHRDCVRALIEGGARVEASTLDQRTCLHIASVRLLPHDLLLL